MIWVSDALQNIPIHFLKPEIFFKRKKVVMDLFLGFEKEHVCFNVI